MTVRLRKIQAAVEAARGRPTVPLPDPPSSLVADLEGWQVHAINSLWADRVNLEGDLYLVTPSGRVLGVVWDVVADETRATDFVEAESLNLALHFPAGIKDWKHLGSEIAQHIRVIAEHYGEIAPSNKSLERGREG